MTIQKRTIFTFWTGDNAMSKDRQAGLDSLSNNSQCHVKLITPDNLDQFILKGHPLHQAYPHLSYTHKSDYLRCYFMHHHGGGYADIKKIRYDWNPYFDALEKSSDAWGLGYQEINSGSVAAPPELRETFCPQWEKAIGLCAYILKPNTPFTSAWYQNLHQELDQQLEQLQKHPARHPRDKIGRGSNHKFLRVMGLNKSKYPLAWAQILGYIFHPLSINHTEKFIKTLPAPDFSLSYR